MSCCCCKRLMFEKKGELDAEVAYGENELVVKLSITGGRF